jgi:hypothetical protein
MDSEGARAAVDWALSTAATDTALRRRARRAAAICLRGVRSSAWAEIAWCVSGLSGGGFPMEVSCSWTRPLIRYTTEVAGPDVDPPARLARAVAILDELGSAAPEAVFLEQARTLQRGAPLRFGAWIGARHDDGGDRYKLYVDAPLADIVCARPFVGAVPSAAEMRLQLIACEPAIGRIETYWRCVGLGKDGLPTLLAALGMAHRTRELRGLVDELFARDASRVLAHSEVGLSLAAPAGGRADRVTLYLRAALLFHGDGEARSRLLAVGARRGAQLAGYTALTAGLEGATTTAGHGLVAVTTTADGPLDVTVDLCPATLYQAAITR